MIFFRSPAAPPDPRIYMLHMLRDLVCHPAPAGPSILHATNATRLVVVSHPAPSDPRFYMLHVLRDFSHAHGPSAQPPCYMCSLAFFDSSTLGPPQIIEKVGPWSIFSMPKNGSTSLQNSLFEHSSKSRSASKRRKTAQFRSKTASSTRHNSVLVVTSRSLRGHFAVTSRSQRGHNAVTTVTTRSLRGHYGHYAVTTVTTRS